MNPHHPKTEADTWQVIASAAGQAPQHTPGLPPGFVDKVLARLPRHSLVLAAQDRERVVSLAACLTLAASLLVLLLSWNSIEAAWSSAPPVFDQPGFDGVLPGFDAVVPDLDGAGEPWQ